MAHQIDTTRQNVIIARLSDFCQWSSRTSNHNDDPWEYMRYKILEMREPVSRLKQDQLSASADAFLTQLNSQQLTETDIIEFKTAIHGYLSSTDFIDISINLTPEALANTSRRELVVNMVREMRAASLFEEAEISQKKRSPETNPLVRELYKRLGLDIMDQVLAREPRSPRTKRAVMRRIRRNVAEYCSVLHLSFGANDTFSPFMLLRVEALLVSCLRILNLYR